jgi:hypothetical protein
LAKKNFVVVPFFLFFFFLFFSLFLLLKNCQKDEEICFAHLRADSVGLSLGGVNSRLEMRYSDTVGDLLRLVDGSHFLSPDDEMMHEATQLALAVVPGARFFKKDKSCSFTVQLGTHPIAVVSWLSEIGCQECSGLFTKSGLEDFFALPFLTAQTLDAIGVLKEHHRRIILSAAKALHSCSPVEFVGKWLHYLGCEKNVIIQVLGRKKSVFFCFFFFKKKILSVCIPRN